jgi:hypothetical protein
LRDGKNDLYPTKPLPIWPTIARGLRTRHQVLARKSLKDEAFLATIQNELKGVLGETAELNGYDVRLQSQVCIFAFSILLFPNRRTQQYRI